MKKKYIPVLVAVALIVVVALIGLSTGLLEKYSYSQERADLNTYFNVAGGEETAIIFNDTLIETDALYRDDHVYFPLAFVDENLKLPIGSYALIQLNNNLVQDSLVVPANAVSVSYTLTKEDGEVISNQSERISEETTTITINKNNIDVESGYLELIWTIESTDELGNVVQTEESGFSGTVDFTMQ